MIFFDARGEPEQSPSDKVCACGSNRANVIRECPDTEGSKLLENSAIDLFAGKRVLIVEDEYFLADETRRKLEAAGATVVGPVGAVAAALDLLDTENVDAAILDIHLGEELVFPVADELERRDIPFVFATGYDPSILPAKFTGFTLCEKPTELGDIAKALFIEKPAGLH
jgi:CheY-like chemotaxis protein